ncbi:YrhC family protein [Evansella sp. AB-P1]|uniref:YrhC family protein n=1 Tax=Evansella sp. AB-P1 TaxID=3037653 RepID=UPI00241F92E3|nr:YrhC family protein [Evansella sp. AB-P1]MDG5786487.1 YrhC family protein [Evansella sp. AB-P1]
MDEKKIIDLKNKVIDLKRFAFILLALCGFLAIGLVLPDNIAGEHQGMMIGLNALLLIAAIYFHRTALATQRKLLEEE